MEMTTMTIMELVENNVDIFDFDYPIYKEEFRSKFEQLFIDHFYFDEIGVENVARFKHVLKTKLNLIMPYWNKVYETQELELRILNNYELTEVYTRDTSSTINGTVNNTNKNLYKDAPKTKVDIDQLDIVNSITKDIGVTTNVNTDEGTENYTRTTTGNVGVATDSDAIVNYWGGLRKTTLEIFEKELSVLFMGVY